MGRGCEVGVGGDWDRYRGRIKGAWCGWWVVSDGEGGGLCVAV